MKNVINVLTLWAGAVLLLAVAMASPARAEPRIALIIGNGAYQSVNPLANPVQDAELMARTLQGLGFEVTLLRDGDKEAISRAVAEFGGALRDAGTEATGLFYYAGHGVQSFQRNYLLPVETTLTNAADLDLVAVDAEAVLRQMASARNKTNIFILDACRNNPFLDLPDLNDKGLAEMKAPTGTFLAYATAPGEVALDGDNGHSPFTRALAALMISQGMPIEQVFKEVRIAVLQATDGAQTPWDTSSLTGNFTFSTPVASADEEALWQTVSTSGDPVKIKLFLKAYPETQRRAEAEALLSQVMPEPTQDVAAGEVADDMKAAIAAADVTFDGPITTGSPEITGSSIAELIETGPMFTPIAGLPDEAWMGLGCKDCHQWTKEALCDQGKFYGKQDKIEAVESQHPLGGTFKLNLRAWAEQGCR